MPKQARSREARTRGADLGAPINRPDLDTPGFAHPKVRRTMTDLLGEHRIQMINEAKHLGLTAATDFEAAEWFGVSDRTLKLWKVRDPAFAAALRLGKDIADGRVEATLYQKAVGYSYRAEKIFVNADGVTTRVPYIEHVVPSDTAIIFWLKNRKRYEWTDQQRHVVEIEDKTDPRKLAMAVLATLREAHDAALAEQTPMIEAGNGTDA